MQQTKRGKMIFSADIFKDPKEHMYNEPLYISKYKCLFI